MMTPDEVISADADTTIDADVAVVGGGVDAVDAPANQTAEATVNTDDDATNEPNDDEDNHSNQDSDLDYTEFLEDVFMQVPPPEKISWSDIIERKSENGADENSSEGDFAAFVDSLAIEEDPDVIEKRMKKQAEFAGFVAFVETPDKLVNTDFLPPLGSDDENSVEKVWDDIVSGMAEPTANTEVVEEAPLLSWALSWFNPAAWSQPVEVPGEVSLEKKEKKVGPADDCISETDASEASSQAIIQMQMV